MNVLVIGCGKLGSRLADNLCRHGHSVSVIDKSEDLFKNLSDDFDGITVAGMPMDIEDLRSAGVENCDAVATVTDDDNLNITASQIVKEFFGIENVITRVVDPSREKIFKDFGLKTICETKLSAEAMFSALVEKTCDEQLTFGSSVIDFIVRDAEPILIGRTMDKIPNRYGEIVLGLINKDSNVILNKSKKHTVINFLDKIIYARVIE